MKSIFSKKDNVLMEQPDTPEPIEEYYRNVTVNVGSINSSYGYDLEKHKAELAACRTLPCAPNSFVDGVEYEEGKDYYTCQCCYNSCDGLKCKYGSVHIIAVPITQSNDEDEAWSQAISIIETAKGTKGLDYINAYKKLHEHLKSRFTITRKNK